MAILDEIGQPFGDCCPVAFDVLGLRLPRFGSPDFNKGVHTNDDGFTFNRCVCPQPGRNQDAALPIKLHVNGVGKEHTAQLADIWIADRECRDPFGQRHPGVKWVDEQAWIEATCNNHALGQLVTEAGRQRQAAFRVQVVVVTPEKHD